VDDCFLMKQTHLNRNVSKKFSDVVDVASFAINRNAQNAVIALRAIIPSRKS